MKTKEELNALKEEVETVSKKLHELTEEELEQVIGGESFKASLSLALGLSDTVSSKLGGIQMEALFVDEGFGTLDRKSIENAMDILLKLSGRESWSASSATARS